MTQSLCILGRQPALGLAELESLFGAEKLRAVGTQAALLDIEPALIDFSRLGGTIKFCKVLTTLDTTNWHKIQTFLESAVPEHASALPEGKLSLGLSAYGLKVTPQHLIATGLTLKKLIRATNRPVRIVPNVETALNSAQVLHNQLTSQLGWELVFVADGPRTIIAQSIAVQDITAYTVRDRGRPNRDARIGMLPPKLAQVIINLAVGSLEESGDWSEKCGEKEPSLTPYSALHTSAIRPTILDPFCGTGVILQEAALMGYSVVGTDLEPRMIDYSGENLMWLDEHYPKRAHTYSFNLTVGDATSHQWTQSFDIVASEMYLGRPFTSPPSTEVLSQTVGDCNTIVTKFLRNIHAQLQPGTRLCLAVPAWQTRADAFRHLPMLDQISDLGYNRVSFQHVQSADLIYYRPNQFVARELLVLSRV